jgi:dipeptidyl aminopeptidase/acylaminoacyl peptidase
MNQLSHSFVYALAGLYLMTSTSTGAEDYRLPPRAVVDIVDAEPEPAVSLSPDAAWMVLVERDAMPGIADVSRRMLRLAGVRIDPAANGRFATSYYKGLSLRHRDDGDAIRVPVAPGARIGWISWAHDSQTFVYAIVTDAGTQVWAAGVNRPDKPTMLTDRLSSVMGGLAWLPDAKHVVCRLVPQDRGDEPADPLIPSGPNIQESSGNTSPTRTYQDLLSNAHDEALFDFYAIGQLAVIDLAGKVKQFGEPAVYSRLSVSPSGDYLLVTTIDRPYSYLMTYHSFPQRIEVWDFDGNLKHVVANVPMAEDIPIEGVRTGPRGVEWMSARDAQLVWMEALDGGDPNRAADHRDRYVTLAAPFDDAPQELLKVQHRGFGMSYFANPSLVTTTEYDRDRRWVRSLLHNLSDLAQSPKVLTDRSIRDRYGDPGSLLQTVESTGHSVARQDGDWVYRAGAGASPKGNLPFLDRQSLASLKVERLWRCNEGSHESVVKVVASAAETKPKVVTVHETVTSPPNFHLRDLEAATSLPLTDFKDPTPQIRGVTKQLVTYEREDGIPLSATLYLPADYQKGTQLPLIVWAYPREFNDRKTAGQVSASPSRFTRMRGISHLTLLTQGYAIMDEATMPIVGDPETMNDTFIEQIVGAAKAAINKAVDLGVADPDRVGVGGHSYGAFMTANLMAHCDLFNAGVARSGAYNRTLTPFGFQSERRSFWDAKKIYYSISPFMHADKINEPLLLIHGEADNNSGTFPMQSERLFQAIKGNGGTVRLVLLPNESHSYRARESVLHTQAETIEWFDKHVKNAAGSR